MAREMDMRVAREREQNTKDAILDKLSADMAQRQAEAEEMDRLRNELIIQETEENIIQKEKEKMQRAIQQRMDVALANEYQRQLKAIKREEEKKDRIEIERLLEDRRTRFEAERAKEEKKDEDAF